MTSLAKSDANRLPAAVKGHHDTARTPARRRPDSPATALRQLHGLAGNQAVGRLFTAAGTGGHPLPAALRGFFEPRFGRHFGAVRLHTGAAAERSAAAFDARAFTVGKDIVVGSGQPALDSPAGRHLLAHELTHVVQQAALEPRAPALLQREPAGSSLGQSAVAAGLAGVAGAAAAAGAGAAAGAASAAAAQAGAAATATCALDRPAACATYDAWLSTFPAATGTIDTAISTPLPKDLRDLIQSPMRAGGGLPDCADVALILRHYYLKARGQSLTFKVGRTAATADTFTLGKNVADKEARACLLGAGTESFQEERKGFSLVSFYREKGQRLLNLKKLVTAGLKGGDMFVWKRRPEVTGNFQGHSQTVQTLTPPTTAQPGAVIVLQGNMSGGKGVGSLEQRTYSFTELTTRRRRRLPISATSLQARRRVLLRRRTLAVSGGAPASPGSPTSVPAPSSHTSSQDGLQQAIAAGSLVRYSSGSKQLVAGNFALFWQWPLLRVPVRRSCPGPRPGRPPRPLAKPDQPLPAHLVQPSGLGPPHDDAVPPASGDSRSARSQAGSTSEAAASSARPIPVAPFRKPGSSHQPSASRRGTTRNPPMPRPGSRRARTTRSQRRAALPSSLSPVA